MTNSTTPHESQIEQQLHYYRFSYFSDKGVKRPQKSLYSESEKLLTIKLVIISKQRLGDIEKEAVWGQIEMLPDFIDRDECNYVAPPEDEEKLTEYLVKQNEQGKVFIVDLETEIAAAG